MSETPSVPAPTPERPRTRTVLQVSVFIGALLVVSAAGYSMVTLFNLSLPNGLVPPVDLKTTEETEVPYERSRDPFSHVRIVGSAAIVYDLSTGEVLYEKNAYAQLPLASLTKLLTVYTALQSLSLEEPITITKRMLEPEGDTGLQVGDTLSVGDAMTLALVASSNDATAAIEHALEMKAGATAVALSRNTAAAVGLTQTYTLNSTGLDENTEISGGYGSAHDVALLAGALVTHARDIARISTRPVASLVTTSGTSYTIENTNPDVEQIPGILLSKTGYTDLAGGNLVIVVDVGIGHPVAIAVLGSTRDDRFEDVRRLRQALSASFLLSPTL